MKLSDNFTDDEFRCFCCNQLPEGGIDAALVAKLETLRAELCKLSGRDVKITVTPKGGYRCPVQNERSDGARSSQHLLGNAADIVANGWSAPSVAQIAARLFPDSGGIGTYPTFTHIDSRRQLARWNGK